MNRMTLHTLAAALAITLASVLPASAFATTLKIEVNGLVCSFCAHGIKSAFEKQAAAGDVLVSLENRLVAVDLKDGQDIADAVATRLLTDAGYTVVKIERVDTTVAALRAEVGGGD